MGAKSDSTQGIEKSDSTDANTNASVNRNHVDPDETPPIYYDAEPSAQPPRYPDNPSTSSTSRPKPPTNQRHSSGAPASTIAAVLGSEYSSDLDAQRRADRKKKSLRERWNDFKERNFGDYDLSEDRAAAGSAAEWNVQGGRLKGGIASPYRRKGK